MKITCEREKLLSAFQTVTPVVPSRSPKPILQSIKIDAGKDLVTLMGTDLEIGIRVEVQGVQVDQPGMAILPTQRFQAILRESSDEFLKLEADDSGLTVRGDRSRFNLQAQDPHEFPNIATFQEQQFIKLPTRVVREVIRRTVFATDSESSRFALGGVLFEFDGGRLTAVGTDGRRMAVVEAGIERQGDPRAGDAPTIIPARALTVVDRALGDAETECWIAPRHNDVLIKSGPATIYSRLVEGRFPRWRDVLPSERLPIQVSFVVGSLLSAVRQAAIVTDPESRGVDFQFEEGRLVLAARVADAGKSEVEVPIAFTGAAVGITLDPRYLIDFLRVLDAEKSVVLDIQDGESAVICNTEDGYRYVIMPLARD